MTEILTDVIGTLRVDSPEEAIALQLPIGLDFISDGQVYCSKLEEPNLPFLLGDNLQPLLPQITVVDYGVHKIVRLKGRLEETIDPSRSLIVRSFERAAKEVESKKGQLESLKFIHPLPLTILNTFTIESVRNVYGKNPEILLRDIRDKVILPAMEYLSGKYPIRYFQGDDPAIFDEDVHGPSLIEQEFLVIEEICEYCHERDIKFACYVPDVPLPENLQPQKIRRRLLGLSGTISWEFFYSHEEPGELLRKLDFIRRSKGTGITLALGIVDSNRPYIEDLGLLVSKVKQAIAFLNPDRLHLSPIGGFKGVNADIARKKMRMLVEVKSLIAEGLS